MRNVATHCGSQMFSDVYGLVDAIGTALGDGRAGPWSCGVTSKETGYLLDLLMASDAPAVLTEAMPNLLLTGPNRPANILRRPGCVRGLG